MYFLEAGRVQSVAIDTRTARAINDRRDDVNSTRKSLPCSKRRGRQRDGSTILNFSEQTGMQCGASMLPD